MKTHEILAFYAGLNKIAEDSSRVFPGKIAYAISRNVRKLAPIVEDYEQTRVALIKKYGKPSEEKEGTYVVDLENQEGLNEELVNLLNTDNDDIKLSMIHYSDIEGLTLSIADMEAFYPMIKEDEEG